MNKRFLNKDWWDFKGTVNGTKYFLRPLWGLLFILPGALVLGGAVKSSMMKLIDKVEAMGPGVHTFTFGDNIRMTAEFFDILFTTGSVIGLLLFVAGYIATFWLSLSTINKRLNSITPDQKFFGWFMSLFFNGAMSIYLTFKNAIPKKPDNGTVFVPAHWRTARDGKKGNNLSSKK